MSAYLNQYLVENGLRPAVDNDSDIIGPQWFSHLVEIPNAATTAINLRDATIFTSDRTIQTRWGVQSSGNVDRIVHAEQVHLNIFGGAWAALALTEKQKVVEGAYLYAKQGGQEIGYDLGEFVAEAYQEGFVTFDSDDTAAAVVRGSLNGPPLVLPKPLTLDLNNDVWEIRFSTATPAGPIKAKFRWFGTCSPNTVKLSPMDDKGAFIVAGDGTRIGCNGNGRLPTRKFAAFDQASGYLGARALELGRRTG